MNVNEYDVLRQAVTLLDKKKALDMVVLDVSELTVLSHYFVICSGGSTSQLHALSDELKEKMGQYVLRCEGTEESGWIIIDLEGVMVHIFNRQMRDYYSLEHLWEDTGRMDINELIIEEEGTK
ncbi:MAG: ribosome silencing factor [Clostridia bacterium]|nr:ribosome silencing factor [Clostridia bacterium]